MTRAVPEWIGKNDDVAIPERVRLRVFDRWGGRCACCGRKILEGETWDVDHIVALANGGSHEESNLQPLLAAHHKLKTRKDVAIKSKTYRVRSKHLGIRRQSSRPMPGSRASGWKKTFSNGWERRNA